MYRTLCFIEKSYVFPLLVSCLLILVVFSQNSKALAISPQLRAFLHEPSFYRHPTTGKLNTTKVKSLIRDMYLHGWQGYLLNAYPKDDLCPVTCTGRSTIAGKYLTLIDAADGLAVIGEIQEFRKAVQLISQIKDFDMDVSVSVFESTIRLLGGLLSSHVFANKHLPEYDGKLLTLAKDLGDRLILAFNTTTGINYGSINLRRGINFHDSQSTCPACGALTIEFGYLSYLTGNSSYYNISKRSVVELWNRRTPIDLFGKYMNVMSGHWASYETGIASELDSFYEYLIKSYFLFHDKDFLVMFDQAYHSIERHSKQGPFHSEVNTMTGAPMTHGFYHLEAFWAGLQVTIGDVSSALDMLKLMGKINAKYAFIPEAVSVPSLHVSQGYHVLRPEAVESIYYGYLATRNIGFQEYGFELLQRFNNYTITKCGFASLKSVLSMTKEDHMESFFLAETLKYLYLLFDENNEVNKEPMIFSTEAHPFPIPPHSVRKLKHVFPNASLAAMDKFNPFIERCEFKDWHQTQTALQFSSSKLGFNFLTNDGRD